MGKQISFASFGLVVLDEIRFPNRQPLTDVLGGSGAYATLGARLFLPSPMSRSLAFPINVGHDFPDSIAELLQSWNTHLITTKESDQPSTRGLLKYQDTTFGPKKFKYTTPILAVQENELTDATLLTSKVYHYLASPEDMKKRVPAILALREQAGIQSRHLIVWEPAPLSCKAKNLQECLEAACLVDVFSPNHIESAAFFEESPAIPDKAEIERLASCLLASGVGPEGKGTVIVRAGENGCFIKSRDVDSEWIPPFHIAGNGEDQATKVVDPTGAGNAFLGGYSIGHIQTGGDIIQAACFGSVAASFAIEQVGMPEMKIEGAEELWNGVSVSGRLDEYRARQESARNHGSTS